MIHRAFSAMGTRWWIAADQARALPSAEALVHEAERCLSRFDPRSALSRLNRERQADDPVLVEVLRAAEATRLWTGGAFDARLGAQIRALGYDRDFAAIRRPRALETGPSTLGIEFRSGTAQLHGVGDVDLGGLAKGWTIDQVTLHLAERGAREAIVDGGGDIRVIGGPHALGVAGDGAILLADAAVATSSRLGRWWVDRSGRRHHHLLDPATGRSATGTLDVASVVARSAMRAEIVAKALLVRPALAAHVEDWGARVLAIDVEGQAWCSPGWEAA